MIDAYKLSVRYTTSELLELMKKTEDAGRIPNPGFWLYDSKTRKNLSEIAWAIAYRKRNRREAAP